MSNQDEETTRVEVGYKDGHVVLNLYGTSTIEPSHIVWTPEEAREVAGHLLRCAAVVDEKSSGQGAAG